MTTLEQPTYVSHTHDDEDFCHKRVAGTDRNFCGVPVRHWRLHTSLECALAGHTKCLTCALAHATYSPN